MNGARLSGELDSQVFLVELTAWTLDVFAAAFDCFTDETAFLVAMWYSSLYETMAIVYHNHYDLNTSDIIGYMALFIRQNDDRTELQQRLATELQERAKKRATAAELPDGVDDSQYIKGTRQTTNLAWVWILIVVLAIGGLIWLTILNATR